MVVVDPAVNDRMYDHFEFLARVSESAAESLLESLAEDMQSLERLPFRNPVFNRPYLKSGKYRYMVSCERYLIVSIRLWIILFSLMIYRTHDKRIIVICFIHNRLSQSLNP